MISEIYKYIFLFKANKDATALNNPQYFANPWFAKYEVAQKGLTHYCHQCHHYSNDDHVHYLSYQHFLVSIDILVVLILEKGKKDLMVDRVIK